MAGSLRRRWFGYRHRLGGAGFGPPACPSHACSPPTGLASCRITAQRTLITRSRKVQGEFGDTFSLYWISLIWPAACTPEEYQFGLRLAEALSGAVPENRDFRFVHAMALYRVGRYAEALSLLEDLQRERQRAIISQVGQRFMSRWPVGLLVKEQLSRDTLSAMGFLAMTLYHLGHRDQARAVLADLRALLIGQPDVHAEHLFREAETLIEGKPRPEK